MAELAKLSEKVVEFLSAGTRTRDAGLRCR
jgi:hypothetical protein